MDPITDVLHDLKLEQTYFCCSEFRPPWGIQFPARSVSAFHAVIRGSCIVEVGQHTAELEPGGFALLPQGIEHALVGNLSDPRTPAADLNKVRLSHNVGQLVLGGDGSPTEMLCGIVKCGGPLFEQMRGSLPELLTLDPKTGPSWLKAHTTVMLAEAGASRPGSLTILQRLAEVLVIQALRHWMEGEGLEIGWVRALCDPQIGRALALIHREPARGWTVAGLASAVHMSRPVFAERFRRLVGSPPMKYLTLCRLRAASEALRAEGRSVGEIAAQLGYESEAAFSRAFKRMLGVTPSAVRRGAMAARTGGAA